jgi:hypothetical protein
MTKKTDLPGWFPYALTASFLVMVGAGIKSGWKLSGNEPPPPPPPPTPPGSPQVKQAGVLQAEWGIVGAPAGRWFFWYVLPQGATVYGARGPEYLTDQGAFQLEFDTRSASLGVQLYRYVWVPSQGIWVYDSRTQPALLASREIRDQQGNVVG